MSKPSVKDLYAISISLRVQIGWFLLDKEPADARERGVIVRAGNRRGYESAGISTEALSTSLGEELDMMLSTVQDRKRVVSGKRVSVCLDPGGSRLHTKKNIK